MGAITFRLDEAAVFNSVIDQISYHYIATGAAGPAGPADTKGKSCASGSRGKGIGYHGAAGATATTDGLGKNTNGLFAGGYNGTAIVNLDLLADSTGTTVTADREKKTARIVSTTIAQSIDNQAAVTAATADTLGKDTMGTLLVSDHGSCVRHRYPAAGRTRSSTAANSYLYATA